MSTTTNRFAELAAINVGPHIEKKAGLSYLSWAWALDQLLRLDGDASWEYAEPKMFGDTMMVFCTVTAFGKPRTAFLPVMDHRNQPIKAPNAFQVNTAMQRCLVKAIALHGLGLYIYAGEDLPPGEEGVAAVVDKPTPRPISGAQVAKDEYDALPPEARAVVDEWAANVTALVDEGRADEANAFLHKNCTTQEDKLAIWAMLGSKTRTALKKAAQPSLASQA